jgi:hypothetical protein
VTALRTKSTQRDFERRAASLERVVPGRRKLMRVSCLYSRLGRGARFVDACEVLRTLRAVTSCILPRGLELGPLWKWGSSFTGPCGDREKPGLGPRLVAPLALANVSGLQIARARLICKFEQLLADFLAAPSHGQRNFAAHHYTQPSHALGESDRIPASKRSLDFCQALRHGCQLTTLARPPFPQSQVQGSSYELSRRFPF